jgi:hypothetical protein
MMHRYVHFLLFLLTLPVLAFAQTGKLSGRITDATSKETIPFANVRVLSGGSLKGGGTSDIKGDYSIGGLTPGVYDVEVSFTGYSTTKISGVRIGVDRTERLDVKLSQATLTTTVVDVVYTKPLIDKDGSSTGARISADQIANFGTRDFSTMITAVTPTVFSADAGGGLFIKGNRSGDNATYINGVRQFGSSLPPPESVEEVAVITGGIPAEYGDALGGVISYTTKNAASKFNGGVQLQTSRPFNTWRNDLISVSASGPLLMTKEKTVIDTAGKSKVIAPRALIGFYSVLQYSGARDGSPSAYGYWKVKDDVLERYANDPIVTLPNGGLASKGNFFTRDSMENIKYRPNAYSGSLVYNGTFDYQPSENILVSVGGNVEYNRGRNGADFRLFNYSNNSQTTNINYNLFARFRQSFPSGKNDLLKNVYYQVQFDVSRSSTITQDAVHKDKLSRYNYYGTLEEETTIVNNFTGTLPSYNPDGSQGDPRVFSGTLLNSVTGLRYRGSDINSDLNKWNLAVLRSRQGFLTGFNSANIDQLDDVNFGINGGGLNNIGYSLSNGASATSSFGALGNSISGFGRSLSQQYRVNAVASAEIKSHTIKVGFQYEQRVISSFNGPTNIIQRGRNYANQQFSTRFAARENADGTIELLPAKRLDANGKLIGQRAFDKNLRARANVSENDWLNVDAINPDLITLDLFSVSDIFGGGFTPMASWSGFDPFGNRQTQRTSFDDFFLDTVNRPIDAWRPIYIAGFIEDKFELRDVTIRIGLRLDRFDANQRVLRDPYSLTRLRTVDETNMLGFANGTSLTSNPGGDAAIYVNRDASSFDGTNQNIFSVRGYRVGNRFFNASGVEIDNARELEENGNLYPWYNIAEIKNDPIRNQLWQTSKLTLDAFTAYKPQLNILPRVAFSFPISETALFFAHYDVLTQRPLNFGGGSNFGSPIVYYALAQQGNGVNQVLGQVQYIPNPNLKPQRKVDYEIGFQQALNERSALKITAAYSEIRDLIAIIRINNAFPTSYNTDGNQDFGTVKSLSLGYELRKTENLTLNANYSLQFAETSASGFAANQLNNTRNPNLRNTLPAGYDTRHSLKGNIDFRYGSKQGPRIKDKPVFQNAGINFTANTFSGTPYTRYDAVNFNADQIEGFQNGSRLPWNIRCDIRINKEFHFQKEGGKKRVLNAYIYITNIFDTRNILGVYPRTGSAKDDGYLASDLGQRTIQAATAGGIGSSEAAIMYYNMTMLNPGLVSLPRQAQIGVTYNF